MPSSAEKVAFRFLVAGGANEVYLKALGDLEDLSLLSENAQEIIDTFNAHYASSRRSAGMDPRIVSEGEILTKVVEGLKHALQTVGSLESLVKIFPEEKKYAKALADARKMSEKLSKQAEASRKIIRTISKKIAPKEISDLGKKVESKIESRLLDPSQIETSIVQGQDWQKNVEFYFVVKAVVPSPNPEFPRPNEIRLWLVESLAVPGVKMGVNLNDKRAPFSSLKPATVEGAVQEFFSAVRGWKNVKGESESQAARSSVAKSVAVAVNTATRRMGGFDSREAQISGDFRTVSGEYRSYNLPKEGAYSVGEYEFERLVARETSEFRKAVEAALAPLRSQIDKVSIYGGEKSWMTVEVTLK